MKADMNITILDLETTPILGWTWGLYEQDVIEAVETSYLLCFAYKQLGKRGVHSFSLPDFPLYKREPHNDRELVKKLWEVINSADVIVAHNGDKFDIKKSNALFFKHGLNPPKPFHSVDTLKESRGVFKFDSHKLNAIAVLRKIGEKKRTGGFDLWKDCMAGKQKAWDHMVEYNKRDVSLLEEVYLIMRPWMKHHPTVSSAGCPFCGSERYQSRGDYSPRRGSMVYTRFVCNQCGKWFRSLRGERSEVSFAPI